MPSVALSLCLAGWLISAPAIFNFGTEAMKSTVGVQLLKGDSVHPPRPAPPRPCHTPRLLVGVRAR